jgi:hypothetical protein
MSVPGGQRKYVSRWTISAAIVVLAHVGIAGAVLTWRKVIAPAEFLAPVVVNLFPAPPAPAQAERAPVTGAPAKPGEHLQEQRDDGSASRREERPESRPTEQPRVAVTVPPSESGTTELGADTKMAIGGGAPALQVGRGSNPIDMINPGLPSNKGAKSHDQRNALKNLLARLAMHSGGHHPPSLVFRSVARNAIGALEDHRGGVTGVVGSTATRPATGANHTATNAIGATVVLQQSTGGPGTGPRPTAPLASNTVASPNAGITGTGLRRAGSGTSSIGGPATAGAGINGTTFRSR